MAKSFSGVVKSNKNDKTIVVIVQTRKTHPLYRKQYIDSRNFMAHDEKNEAQVGDKVSIVETRPISAKKRFRLEKVLEKAQIQHVEGVEARPTSKSKAEKPQEAEEQAS
jgi:small subunit ribosomal protein S17